MGKIVIESIGNGDPRIQAETRVIFKSFIFDKVFRFQSFIDKKVTSPSGRYILINFSIYPSDDSDRLVLFDISDKKLKFSIPEFHYSFNETFSFSNDEKLIICHTEVCDLFMDLDGNVQNERDFYASCIKKGKRINRYIIEKFIDLFGNSNENRLLAIGAIDKSLDEYKMNPKIIAESLRHKAELMEENGELSPALQVYKDAMKYDGRIGVKKKIKDLSKITGEL